MKTKLQYRTDLLIEWLSDFMAQAVNLVFLLVVFGHTPLLHGWTRDEILFIYGFFLVPYAVFGAFLIYGISMSAILSKEKWTVC